MNYVIAAIGILVLLYDGWLISKGKLSISARCQAVAPPAVDWGIGIAGWVLLCVVKHYWQEFDFTIAVVLAGLWGHMWIANKERYK